MENLDLTKILKDVPKGTKLYSTIYGDIYFDYIEYNNIYPIKCYMNNFTHQFTKEGKHYHDCNGECVLFPSKEQRDWNKFKLPCQFKLGDIIYHKNNNFISIYNEHYERFDICYYPKDNIFSIINLPSLFIDINIDNYRLATIAEQNLFYKKLQKAGYFWNEEINSLAKYKFKIGDKIQNIHTKNNHEIIDIYYDYYILENKSYLKCSNQNKYTKEKFDVTTLKHYDKVLIRYGNNDIWTPQIFSYLDNNFKQHCYKFVIIGGASAPQCIPYEGNEHLIGTTNDCDEYYKTW